MSGPIDDVKAPRGRLPEAEGGALALVGIHPDFDLPEDATPNGQPVEATESVAPAPHRTTHRRTRKAD